MLKKMRWNVIGAAMFAFFAVVLLISVLVNIINYHVVTNRADETLSHIIEYEQHMTDGATSSKLPPVPFMELSNLESNYMTRFFTVHFDKHGNVISASLDYIASIDKSEAIEYARSVLEDGGGSGYIEDYRYKVVKTIDKTTIAFLNTIREQQFIKSLWMLTIAVAGGSLLLVFILVYFLSAKAIRPFVSNIEKQKQFITDASHELKTPLTSISTSIDIITLEHGDDEWTDNIKKQTGRMSKLVGELVTLSKMSEAIPLPNKEYFSLSDAAWEIASVYQPQAKAHEKEINIDIQEQLSYFGEKTAIQQMLSVLLDNAIRYSDEKSCIYLLVEGYKGKAKIEVRNACNFETPPDVKKLFERFYRPDTSRNESTGGTGVGLAIAKAVAEAHGGSIAANCPNGKSMIITAIL